MDKNAAGTGEDPFRVLPDDLLDHILSFLPGDDALQTCVLDTQWRDLWRRKTSLRFILDEWSSYSTQRFNQLVKLIIHLRRDSPLTDCEINPCGDVGHCDFAQTKLLIEYVLKCRVEDLLVCAGEYVHDPLVLETRLISRHLRTIEFGDVDLGDSSLDFSGCPVLEALTIESCFVDTPKISSKSLKHLRFTEDCIFSDEIHTGIAAPRLISLELGNFLNLTPLLEEMPVLEKASVLLGCECCDGCVSGQEDCNDFPCGCSGKSLLLNGLSNAVELKLIAEPELNIVGATGAQEAVEQPLVCAHLKFVYIECEEVDERVCEFLNILSRCGIPSEQITIKEGPCPYSDYSSTDSDSTDSD